MIRGNRVRDIHGDVWERNQYGNWASRSFDYPIIVTEFTLQRKFGPVTEQTTLQRLYEQSLAVVDAAQEARDAAIGTAAAASAKRAWFEAVKLSLALFAAVQAEAGR